MLLQVCDKILIFDASFNQIEEIKISHKFDNNSEAAHHCNDICAVGDSIYVSMFSYSGNFNNDIFDGVLEIDIKTGKVLDP